MIKDKLNKMVKKSFILSFSKLVWFKKKWRKLNSHNFTEAENCFNCKLVKVGIGTYGKINVYHFGNNDEFLSIGNYCSIGPNVTFVLGGEHNYKCISTYPFNVKYGLKNGKAKIKGKIIVEDDVWIGYGATILSGVHIAQGAIIAAGAVVTKNVPPYAIVGGVPAKIVKYRFKDEMIEQLLKLDYGKLTKEMIEKHLDILQVEFRNQSELDWMPKKIN